LEATFVLPAQKAAGIIGTFWGPSVFGLITTALLVTRVPARRVLVGAAGITVGTLVAATTAHDAHTFFTATLVFGFTSTCLFKLMISIGTDQVAGASPQLVTLLILSSTVGSTLAPAISAPIVGIYGAHAGVVMALVCYAGTLAAVVAGIIVERGGRSAAALFPIATEGA
jgi:TsgA-like MFS transporter